MTTIRRYCNFIIFIVKDSKDFVDNYQYFFFIPYSPHEL